MAETSTRARRESGDLSALLLPELRKIATNLGIEGAAELKKPDLVTAITDLQAANREAAKAEREAKRAARNQKRRDNNSNETAPSDSEDDDQDEDEMPSDNSSNNSNNSNNNNSRDNSRGDREWRRDRHRDRGRDRFRDRDRSNRGEREIVLSEDDVLLPVGGLLDILDNYAFLRTAGYLPGPNDVYVSKLSELRPELLKEAMADAKIRAEAIVEATGGSVGAVMSVRSGPFQVTSPDSVDTSSGGFYDTQTIDKTITSTVSVVFKVD